MALDQVAFDEGMDIFVASGWFDLPACRLRGNRV
jgi:hypothetical protein